LPVEFVLADIPAPGSIVRSAITALCSPLPCCCCCCCSAAQTSEYCVCIPRSVRPRGTIMSKPHVTALLRAVCSFHSASFNLVNRSATYLHKQQKGPPVRICCSRQHPPAVPPHVAHHMLIPLLQSKPHRNRQSSELQQITGWMTRVCAAPTSPWGCCHCHAVWTAGGR